MKSHQSIPAREIYLTWRALELAMKDAGATTACDWLSSRKGKQPRSLTGVLGGSGYFSQQEKSEQ